MDMNLPTAASFAVQMQTLDEQGNTLATQYPSVYVRCKQSSLDCQSLTQLQTHMDMVVQQYNLLLNQIQSRSAHIHTTVAQTYGSLDQQRMLTTQLNAKEQGLRQMSRTSQEMVSGSTYLYNQAKQRTNIMALCVLAMCFVLAN